MRTLYESIKASVGIGTLGIIKDWLKTYYMELSGKYELYNTAEGYKIVLDDEYIEHFNLSGEAFKKFPYGLIKLVRKNRKGEIVNFKVHISDLSNTDVNIGFIKSVFVSKENSKNHLLITFSNIKNCKITNSSNNNKETVTEFYFTSNIENNVFSITDQKAIVYAESGLELKDCVLDTVYVGHYCFENVEFTRGGKNLYTYDSKDDCFVLSDKCNDYLNRLHDNNKINNLIFSANVTDNKKLLKGYSKIEKIKLKNGEEHWVINR